MVLTISQMEQTIDFYQQVLGMELVIFGNNRKALKFGSHKINLHQAGKEFEPKAKHPTPGTADICFLTSIPLTEVMQHMKACLVEIVAGPVSRMGATSPIISIYIYDPDGNLIEIANQV